jgi:hypothetical protein
MINNFINTCFATTETLRDIAGYSHLIPAVLSLLLGTFIFVKAKYNLFSRVFLSFVIFFALWLIGDVIIWNSNNYNLVHSIWSMLDFIEIIFYVLSLYFVLVFIYEKDISKSIKFLFLVVNSPFLTFL